MEEKKYLRKINVSENDINEILESIEDQKLKEATRAFFLVKLDKYIKWMDNIDKLIVEEEKNPEDLWNEFNRYSLNIIKEGDKVTSQIKNRLITSRIKDKFRVLVGYWVYQGKLMERGYIKPRGYPGDYKILEGMYDNLPWTKEGIGYLWDKFFINVDYVKSVRKRKDALKKILKKFLKDRVNTEVSVMNLGSGSGREV